MSFQDPQDDSIEQIQQRTTQTTLLQGSSPLQLFRAEQFAEHITNNPDSLNCPACLERFRLPSEPCRCKTKDLECAELPYRLSTCSKPHLYHRSCFLEWLQNRNKNRCPSCRERCYWYHWETVRDTLLAEIRLVLDELDEHTPEDIESLRMEVQQKWKLADDSLENLLIRVQDDIEAIEEDEAVDVKAEGVRREIMAYLQGIKHYMRATLGVVDQL